MKTLTSGILALAAIATLGHFAFGQGESADNQLHPFAFLENLSMVIMPDGHGARRLITDPAMAEMILKDAKPMKTNTILFMHNGQIYLTRDDKMPSGKMLSAAIMHPAK